MDHFPRSRDIPQPQSITFAPPNQPPPDGSRFLMDTQQDIDKSDANIAFMKGPKRKRLAKVCFLSCTIAPSSTNASSHKACDACHKSKRRCDGTGMFSPTPCTSTLVVYALPCQAPCSNWYVANVIFPSSYGLQ
jgi:hypothetical protein